MSRELLLKVKFFSAFAHPVRLQILDELRNGEKSVSDLVKLIDGVSQSQVSNHLACLRDCGLVNARREWRKIYYSLADPKTAQLLRTADDILPKVASKIAACLEIIAKAERNRETKHDY